MPYLVPDHVREPLYAVVPYHNVWRWKSREKHTIRAIKHFIDIGATVVLVEVAFNRREFAFKDSGLEGSPVNCGILGSDPRYRCRYIGLRSDSELWLKENMINVGVQHITANHETSDWQQVCWLDSDVHFLRPNIVGETIHKLQHYSFVQMFSHARDLGPNYEMLDEDYPHANGIGYVEAWKRELIKTTLPQKIVDDVKALDKDVKNSDLTKLKADSEILVADVNGYYGAVGEKRLWPGLAWACTRKAWEDVGGLFDAAIWGGGDWHMSHGLIEKTEGMMRNDLHRNYKKMVMQWYQRCRTHIRLNVGVVEGSITHHWHGKKTGRGYNAKHAILADVGFDPPRHLKKDSQGLYQLHDDRSAAYPRIRDMMRKIAKERNEDSIDL